jgi:hypothetical protein
MRDGEVEAMLAKLDAIIALLMELCARGQQQAGAIVEPTGARGFDRSRELNPIGRPVIGSAPVRARCA